MRSPIECHEGVYYMSFSAYFDAHCDTLSCLVDPDRKLSSNNCHVSLDKTVSFPRFAQVFAIFSNACAPMTSQCSTQEQYMQRVKSGDFTLDLEYCRKNYELKKAALHRALGIPENKLALCLTSQDIENAWSCGKRAAVLACEGWEQIAQIGLERAWLDGVRIVTVTWNYANQLGGSCISNGGLTEQGRSFVKKANELGVVIDVSHGSDALFYDVIASSRAPILASHSNSRAVHAHRRNLTDEQFLALIKNGGAAGINLFAEFLCEGKCTISDVLRHIDHFFALGGEDHVCLGTDFDGCSSLPDEINSVADMPRLADALAEAGYTDAQIDKIFYKNLLRVFREALSK